MYCIFRYIRVSKFLAQVHIKSNQITFIVTSPQHKCLGEWNSYERAPDSAEKQQTIYIWTDSAKKNNKQFTYGQTVQKNNKQFTYGQTVQKNNKQFTYGQTVQKNNNNLPMDRQCKKTTNNLPMDRQCKKTALEHLQCSRQCKKKTTTIYIWTDSAKNNSNLHMDSTYLQTVQKTICKIHIHILSTLSVL